MSIPLQFAFLYDGLEVFVWSKCLLDFFAEPSGGHRTTLAESTGKQEAEGDVLRRELSGENSCVH